MFSYSWPGSLVIYSNVTFTFVIGLLMGSMNKPEYRTLLIIVAAAADVLN